MNTYHAAPWSSSLSPDDIRYRTTHHQRTKQRGNGQQQQRDLDYVTTWNEIERWSVDPGRVQEPAWDSLEQCEEEYRRMELARDQGGPRGSPKNVLGGGTRGMWRSQVGDLRQLPVLTVERAGPGRHRGMPGGACVCIARCSTLQPLVSAGLEWASSQVP